MQGEFEIQLGNLVVDDEDGLIRKRRDGVLQTQQRIEVDVIPIRQVVRIQQAIQVRAEVLPHGGVFVR